MVIKSGNIYTKLTKTVKQGHSPVLTIALKTWVTQSN